MVKLLLNFYLLKYDTYIMIDFFTCIKLKYHWSGLVKTESLFKPMNSKLNWFLHSISGSIGRHVRTRRGFQRHQHHLHHKNYTYLITVNILFSVATKTLSLAFKSRSPNLAKKSPWVLHRNRAKVVQIDTNCRRTTS